MMLLIASLDQQPNVQCNGDDIYLVVQGNFIALPRTGAQVVSIHVCLCLAKIGVSSSFQSALIQHILITALAFQEQLSIGR